jgi:hypothetical protein
MRRQTFSVRPPDYVGTGKFDGWRVEYLTGSHAGGWYYSLNVVGSVDPVTVKLSPRGRHVCLSHNTADNCVHATFVRELINAVGLPDEVNE